MKKMIKSLLFVATMATLLVSCIDDDNNKKDPPIIGPPLQIRVLVSNEGNMGGVGASVMQYNPKKKEVSEVPGLSFTSNCQSVSVIDRKGFVVDAGGKVTVLELPSYNKVGTIEGLTSPTRVSAVGYNKLYVSEIARPFVSIIDRESYTLKGKVTFPKQPEQASVTPAHRRNVVVATVAPESSATRARMPQPQYPPIFFINDWSGSGEYIYMVDVRTDIVMDSIKVTINPNSMVVIGSKLWVLSDGRDWTSSEHKNATLIRINLTTFTVEKTYTFTDINDTPNKLTASMKGTLYFLNNGVFEMEFEAQSLPTKPLIEKKDRNLYGLGVDYITSEIYVSDALDYASKGRVYRYSAEGLLLDDFEVGVMPGSFSFFSW